MGMGLFLSRRHREIVCVWGSVERVCVQHKKPCGELPRGCEGRKEMEEYERNRLNVCKTLNVCEVVVGTVSTHTRLQAHSAPENYPSSSSQTDMFSLTLSSFTVLSAVSHFSEMPLHPRDTFARHSRDFLAEVEGYVAIIHPQKVFVKLN